MPGLPNGFPQQDHSRYQQYKQYQKPQPERPDKRSKPMAAAALALGTAAVSTVCCMYLSFVCGILGIIFALLSKGGEQTMAPNAKTALWLSTAAVALSVVLVAASFSMLIYRYGSMDAVIKAYQEILEMYGTAPMQR